MGTSGFAVPSLEVLANSDNHKISSVVTQPDAKAGRGMKLCPTPVKVKALELGLPVVSAEKIGTISFKNILRSQNADIIFCAAYGKFLPDGILKMTSHGAVNLHPSLLPLYRGAAPVQRCLMDGHKETAITFFRMVREMDAGDILYQEKILIDPEETSGELLDRTARLGAERLPELLRDMSAGRITPIPQDDSSATFAPLLQKGECIADWGMEANEIFNRWRGLTPKPGLFTYLEGKRVRICNMSLSSKSINDESAPGLVKVVDNRLFVSAGSNSWLEILNLQIEGKRSCRAADFINGYKPDGKSFTAASTKS